VYIYLSTCKCHFLCLLTRKYFYGLEPTATATRLRRAPRLRTLPCPPRPPTSPRAPLKRAPAAPPRSAPARFLNAPPTPHSNCHLELARAHVPRPPRRSRTFHYGIAVHRAAPTGVSSHDSARAYRCLLAQTSLPRRSFQQHT